MREPLSCPCALIILSIRPLLLDQRLATIYQLFSWTSVRFSKCPLDKIIVSQGHLTV